jgi:predicted ribosome quality control (RQC) complex YloA/Tae2 family protein
LQESTEQIVAAIVQQTELALGKALMATVEGIGPLAVSEILFRAGLDAKRPTSLLTVDDLAALTAALASLLAPMHSSPTASFVALDATNRLLAVANFEPRHLTAPCLKKFESLNQAIEYASSLAAAPKTNLHQDIAKRVRTELDKLERKILLLDSEWNESQHADGFRQQADLLMTNLHLLKQGLTAIQLADPYSSMETTDATTMEIALDPALSPMQNIQRYYKKYSRAKRAQELIQIQIEQCRQDILYLEGIALSLTDVISNLEVQEIIQELSESGYMPPTPRSRQNAKPSEPRKIQLASGAVILVGRNNRQNDLVTFKHAQPRDLWFHTKDIPGSHVVLRSQGVSPQLPDIEKAAHLAAWFSKARNSANIPVDYTERRYVKKPSGAKPGFVIYEKQKTLRITPTETEINELLQSGVKPSIPR